jgi:hypothetical protein
MSTPNTINDGGEAFPSNGHHHLHRPGMSLRAYFAGQALSGILANTTAVDLSEGSVAKASVTLADALIAELNKTQQ